MELSINRVVDKKSGFLYICQTAGDAGTDVYKFGYTLRTPEQRYTDHNYAEQGGAQPLFYCFITSEDQIIKLESQFLRKLRARFGNPKRGNEYFECKYEVMKRMLLLFLLEIEILDAEEKSPKNIARPVIRTDNARTRVPGPDLARRLMKTEVPIDLTTTETASHIADWLVTKTAASKPRDGEFGKWLIKKRENIEKPKSELTITAISNGLDLLRLDSTNSGSEYYINLIKAARFSTPDEIAASYETIRSAYLYIPYADYPIYVRKKQYTGVLRINELDFQCCWFAFLLADQIKELCHYSHLKLGKNIAENMARLIDFYNGKYDMFGFREKMCIYYGNGGIYDYCIDEHNIGEIISSIKPDTVRATIAKIAGFANYMIISRNGITVVEWLGADEKNKFDDDIDKKKITLIEFERNPFGKR